MFIEQIFILTSKECNSIYLHKSIEYILIILLYRKQPKKTIAYTHKGQRWSLLSCGSPSDGLFYRVILLLLPKKEMPTIYYFCLNIQ